MATDIRTWEIVNGHLHPIETSLSEHGRTESYDLETWITTDPTILRPGLKIIGRQVMTQSGPLDLLGIDRSGDLFVIELKRERLPREALVQAIDYASDIRTWPIERLSEVCAKYTNRGLEDLFNDAFPDVDLESIKINQSQRILLVGFSLESALERMIEWLSEQYGVGINAVVLKYVRTSSGNELLTKTAIISEETEEVRVRNKTFTIAKSDEPGKHSVDELQRLLTAYLKQDAVTASRIRKVLLPACLRQKSVTREELKQELISQQLVEDPKKAWTAIAGISNQVGLERNDFLRQVVSYDYPNYSWEKDTTQSNKY